MSKPRIDHTVESILSGDIEQVSRINSSDQIYTTSFSSNSSTTSAALINDEHIHQTNTNNTTLQQKQLIKPQQNKLIKSMAVDTNSEQFF